MPLEFCHHSLVFWTIMKFLLLGLAGATFAMGQTTVVDCFEEGQAILDIGIIPTEDFERAEADIRRLQAELATMRQEWGKTLAQEKKGFAHRQQEMVTRVNRMEKARSQDAERFQARLAQMQAGFGKQQGEWEKRIMLAEQERATAVRELEESELIRVRDYEAWQKSVKEWEKKAQQAMRTAQMRAAQDAVANTARLAQEWTAEREDLQARLEAGQQARAADNQAWEKSVKEWEQKAQQAMRTGQMKAAQDAVANTARLSADWQAEREVLEAQVVEMTAKLAKLEGALGVQGFEDQQTEVLRLGLMKKSKALDELGTDAARLAIEWRKEREDAQRELAAMRDLYESSVVDVKDRDTRITAMAQKLASKNETLGALANEAEKLSKTWSNQRGGLQKKIAGLESKLQACEKKLAAALAKEEAARKQGAQLKQEKVALLAQNAEQPAPQDERRNRSQLAEQVALAADLSQKLGLAKQREQKLKQGLSEIQGQHADMNKELAKYRQQKEEDAKTIAGLRGELQKAKEQYAAAERDLAQTGKSLAGAQQKVSGLQAQTKQLEGELKQAREELELTRKKAAAGQAAKAAANEKEAQVKNLEGQLGRMMVAQGELEGTLIATLGDFEKLQKAYVQLKAKSANGGEAAQQAMAARQAAEAELVKVRERLKGEEIKLQQAEQKVKEVEAKKKEIEAAAKKEAKAQAAKAEAQAATILATEAASQAGKAALGKCEAELQTARQELGKLQLGHDLLAKEAQALRERFVSIEPVRYQLASANVVAQQERVLAEVRQVLEVYPKASFAISGHTCNLGSEEGNRKLSEERALLLKQFLLDNGVTEDRIAEATGFGDKQPEAPNDTDEGRRQNRRVEIRVVK